MKFTCTENTISVNINNFEEFFGHDDISCDFQDLYFEGVSYVLLERCGDVYTYKVREPDLT